MLRTVTPPAPSLLTAVFVVSLSSACGSDHMADDDVREFHDQIQAANAEVTRHHEVALTAPALAVLETEAGHHGTHMDRIMARMNGMMGGMYGCQPTIGP